MPHSCSQKCNVMQFFVYLHSFYCPSSHNGSLSTSFDCPVGHYCPSGTWSKHQHPCPAGSINPHTRMTKPQDCLPCPPGWSPLTANDYELPAALVVVSGFMITMMVKKPNYEIIMHPCCKSLAIFILLDKTEFFNLYFPLNFI